MYNNENTIDVCPSENGKFTERIPENFQKTVDTS